MLTNQVFWRLNALLHSLAAWLQPSVHWLSIVTFNNDAKLSHRWTEFCAKKNGLVTDTSMLWTDFTMLYKAECNFYKQVNRQHRSLGHPSLDRFNTGANQIVWSENHRSTDCNSITSAKWHIKTLQSRYTLKIVTVTLSTWKGTPKEKRFHLCFYF